MGRTAAASTSRPTSRRARSSSTRVLPTRSTSIAPARRPSSSCRRTSASARLLRPRPAPAQPRLPSSSRRRPSTTTGPLPTAASRSLPGWSACSRRTSATSSSSSRSRSSTSAHTRSATSTASSARSRSRATRSSTRRTRPVFLSVDKLEELALVRHTPAGGTSLHQPEPLAEAESFRALSEFDSDRAELFLARCAVLVEGRTEKLVFPLLFDALGVDADKEGILVLECGGKGNMPLFARICNACDVPYVVVHDRDAARGARPVESERVVEPADPRGGGEPADGRPDARLRDGLRLQAERPRPQAAEGVEAVQGERRCAAGAHASPSRRSCARRGARTSRRGARALRRRPRAPRARAGREAVRAAPRRSPVRCASACERSQSASHGLRGSSGPWRYVPITRPARQPS